MIRRSISSPLLQVALVASWALPGSAQTASAQTGPASANAVQPAADTSAASATINTPNAAPTAAAPEPASQPAPAAPAEAAPAPEAATSPQPAPAEAAPAEAEPLPEVAPHRVHMDLSVAPPDAPLQRNDYVHNGFYLRANLGLGVLGSEISTPSVTSGGGALAFQGDILVGGSPSPGIALGGGVLTNLLLSVPFENERVTYFHSIVGPFFDAFPNAKKGFHLGAEAGLAVGSLKPVGGTRAFGAGGAFWLGYDIWVAPEWSAGFLFRGTGSYIADSQNNASALGVSAMMTVLYN
jgi:hypothetical protein